MGLLKYKIFSVLVLLLISGCARSVIKYATKLDETPYQMYGKTPSREFYLPENISDSLVLKWESEANGSFPNSSVSIYEDLVFINDLSGRIFCFDIETGKKLVSSNTAVVVFIQLQFRSGLKNFSCCSRKR
jgi:hypothetical protein